MGGTVQGLQIPKVSAEKVREILISEEALDYSFVPVKKKAFLVLPLKKPLSSAQKKKIKIIAHSAKIVTTAFNPVSKKPQSLRQALEKELSPEQARELIASFDLLGNIAKIDIPPALEKKRTYYCCRFNACAPVSDYGVQKNDQQEWDIPIT